MTDRCKHITLHQTSFAGGNKKTFKANGPLVDKYVGYIVNKFKHTQVWVWEGGREGTPRCKGREEVPVWRGKEGQEDGVASEQVCTCPYASRQTDKMNDRQTQLKTLPSRMHPTRGQLLT